MKARYTQDVNGFYIKEVKKHWFFKLEDNYNYTLRNSYSTTL